MTVVVSQACYEICSKICLDSKAILMDVLVHISEVCLQKRHVLLLNTQDLLYLLVANVDAILNHITSIDPKRVRKGESKKSMYCQRWFLISTTRFTLYHWQLSTSLDDIPCAALKNVENKESEFTNANVPKVTNGNKENEAIQRVNDIHPKGY